MQKNYKRILSITLAIMLIINMFTGLGIESVHAATSQEYTVIASEDTFVRKSDSNTDWGNMVNGGDNTQYIGYLTIKETNTSSPREAYIKFDLSNYPENITSATLYLYGKNSENENLVTARVYGVSTENCDSWSEGTLTWNTKPEMGSNTIGSMTFNGKSSPSWQSIDVTSFIQSELAGDKMSTFALAGGNAMIRVESKDTTTDDVPGHKAKPYLVINGTPALKSIEVTSNKNSLGIGQSANLSVEGMMDTNTSADLTGATISYSSDNPCVVIDDPSVANARAVAPGTANITVTVTLEGVTKTSSIPLYVDGIAPTEVTNISGDLVNGEYTLTWTDPTDEDLAGVSVFNEAQLLGTVEKGTQSLKIAGLNNGQLYTLTFKTTDVAGNVSSGVNFDITYEAPVVLDTVTIQASKDVLKPPQSVSFTVNGKMTDGSDADLTEASVTYSSINGCLVFANDNISVAEAVYAGPAKIKAVVNLAGIIRESEPVMIRVFPTAQDEYDSLRIKYGMKFTGYNPDEPYDLSDPDISKYIDSLDVTTKSYWDTLDKLTYTWSDLTSTTKSSQLATATSRLRSMSRSWAMYGSAYYQSEELLHDIIECWNVFYETRYNENINRYDNWFDWMVNVPNNINDSMVAIYEALPYSAHPDLLTNLNRAIDKFVPNVSYTAANRVYISKVIMLRGINGKNSEKVQEGSDGLSKVFPYVKSGDGFYEDGSFIQHDYFPYAGGYGKSLLHDISEALWLVTGSKWDNTDSQKINIFDWYMKAFEPNMFNGQLINAVNGREISRDYSYSGYAAINAVLLQLEMVDNPYLEEQKSAVKHHIENGNLNAFLTSNPIWYMQKVREIVNDGSVGDYNAPSGNYNFYKQDNVVHRGEDWLYSISMHSDRMANYETISNENLKSWYQADGMTQLYMDEFDYLSLFWTTVDPSRLPGITVDRDVNRPAAIAANRPYIDISKYQGDGELMENSWTGGVSMNGQYGTAGMDFKQHNYSDMDVAAKKSWFMFDDEIVALGAGINSSSERNIETIVENRVLNSYGDNALTVDGVVNDTPAEQQSQLNDIKWLQLEGTGGYVFPNGSDINMIREERAGMSQDINEKFFIPGNDEFNKTTRSTFWSFINEDNTHYSFNGSALNLTTQQGTLRGTTNSTKNILQTNTPKEDFYVTTSLAFSPTQVGQEAGLILRKNDDNYVYISKGVTPQGSRIIVVNEIGGVAQVLDFPNSVDGNLLLKIDKSGDKYTLYASDNELEWGTAIYTFTNPMAGTDRMNTGLKMGLFAQNGTGSIPEINAAFDYFHLWNTRNYMTLWTDHGIKPNDAEYSYIMLPKKNASEVASYSESPDIEILSNTKLVQAVKESSLGILGMNFWERGSFGDIKANNPSSIMIKENNDQLQIAVSDPTQKQNKISYELKKKGTGVISKDSSITVIQLYPTIKFEVDTSVDPGKTHNVIFSYDSSATVNEFSIPVLANANFASVFNVIGIESSYTPVLTAKMDDNSLVDMSNAIVTFVSNNTTVTTVNNAGVITGVGPGKADITAIVNVNGISKTAKLQVLVPSANPAITTLNPVSDTFIRSGSYESDVYGNDTKLYVKNAGGDDFRETYFSFDLSTITGEIESVKFYATGKVEDTTGTYVDCVLRSIDGSWDETTTNFLSKPDLGEVISGTSRYNSVESQQSFDITNYVREKMKTSTTFDLALVQEVLVGRKMYVYSSENASKQPYIEIVTHELGDSVQNSTINVVATEFDKNTAVTDYKDIAVTVSFNGNDLNAIKNGTTMLVAGTDYSVVGYTYIIKKEYLATLPNGELQLTFDFSAGADSQLDVEIKDTTPLPEEDKDSILSSTTAAFDKKVGAEQDIIVTITFNGNILRAIKNGDTDLQKDIDYTVNEDTVTILKGYLAKQAVGGTTLTFLFSAGKNQTLAISVSDSTQPIDDTDDDDDSNNEQDENQDDFIDGRVEKDESSNTVKIILTKAPVFDKNSGAARVNIDAALAKKAVDQAMEINKHEERKVTINVPKVEGAKVYELTIPAALVANNENTSLKFEVKTEVATLSVTSNMLNTNGKATDVTLTIADVDKGTLSADINSAIGNRPVIELHLKVDGKSYNWNNPGAPVRVSIPYKPTTEELLNPEHIVVHYIDAAGKITSLPSGRYNATTGEVSFTTTHFSQYTIGYVEKSFEDINTYSWAKKQVEVLASKGIISGTGEKTFAPASNITRADFLVMLVKTLGLSAKVEDNFSDIKPEDYYYEALGIAKKLGISTGVGNNLFNPKESISRQDMMVLTAKAMRVMNKLNSEVNDAELGAFVDRNLIAYYAIEDVAALVEDGLIVGDGNSINPLGYATRAEVAVIMYKIYNK